MEEVLPAALEPAELAVPEGALAGAFFCSEPPEDAPPELPPVDGASEPAPVVFEAAEGAAEFLPRESFT